MSSLSSTPPASSPFTSPTLSSISPLTSMSSSFSLTAGQPQITPAPTSCPPNTLVIRLTTTLVIPNYNLFYAPTSIESFVPEYSALGDGSLLTPPFHQDMSDANLSLLIIGALAMLFTRNIIVSGDYIRRGKVKKKILFYVLFLSQILAPVGLVPIIFSYFSQRIHCNLVIILSCLSGTTSLALLITGILGIKAYKCLNNARFVPVILGLFQAASTTVVAFDVIKTKGIRRLTGSCIRSDDIRFTRFFVTIQFLESLFICGCFLYVCWKSRGSPAARGRVSLELSMDDLPIDIPKDPLPQVESTRRGWWDYVPENRCVQQKHPDNRATQGRLTALFARIFGRQSSNEPVWTDITEKKSNDLQVDPQNAATATEIPTSTAQAGNELELSPRHSMALSSISRLSRLFPRMELFQEVMKDELFYTTFITSTCVIVAVLAVIGVNFKNGLSVTGWIALNWGIISMLAIHSFGRVVHRHERDALLHHPVTCTAIMRAANNIAKKGEGVSRRPGPSNYSPRRRTTGNYKSGRGYDRDDPFADTRPLGRDDPFRSSLDDLDSASISSLPCTTSPPGSSSIAGLRNLPSNVPTSPLDLDYALSNLQGTPAALRRVSESSRRKEFSGSWLIAPSSASSGSPRHSGSSGDVRRDAIT
ncbi:hypothetical protein B0H34DRAFT_792626 [Crassisporium funariophilum]|nr:hypothetical protein B0H34DRAFT_792626 [Crassisporium funariophilum]